MPIRCYIFTGFLDSGKTSLILETLADPQFKTKGEVTLVLCFEQGETPYENDFLDEHDTYIEFFDSITQLTPQKMEELADLYKPDEIFIEYNGMEPVSSLADMRMNTERFVLVQILTTINAQTFGMYVANMRSLVYEQMKYSTDVICNRCDATVKKNLLRGNIKAISPQAQIIYENPQGEIVNLSDEDLPFDLKADCIEVSDQDYGIWYMDAVDHPEHYEGKKIRLKGQYLENVPNTKQSIVLGRRAMVCCEQDTSIIGVVLTNVKKEEAKIGDWLIAEGTMKFLDDQQGGISCVLYPEKITFTHDVPTDPYVSFS